MDPGTIVVGLLAGLFGVAYMIYGKRSMDFAYLIAGFFLVLYPFLISNLAASILVGSMLVAGPIVYNRFF